jgi:hypothetical protein
MTTTMMSTEGVFFYFLRTIDAVDFDSDQCLGLGIGGPELGPVALNSCTSMCGQTQIFISCN